MERPTDGRWQQWTSSDWDAFAEAWLAELREPSPTPGSDAVQSASAPDLGHAVMRMNFTADPDDQWQFILCAVAHAHGDSDDVLSHIAAGPVEHLLGWHGEDFIARVEAQAAADETFARMMTTVYKYMMTDEIWERVQAIQARARPRDE